MTDLHLDDYWTDRRAATRSTSANRRIQEIDSELAGFSEQTKSALQDTSHPSIFDKIMDLQAEKWRLKNGLETCDEPKVT